MPDDDTQQGDLNVTDTPPANDSPAGNDAPAAPADDTQGTLPVDHPATDSNVDTHEAYDEGTSGAVEASEPNSDDIAAV
jgi:hypothetical protein